MIVEIGGVKLKRHGLLRQSIKAKFTVYFHTNIIILT